MAYSKEIRRPVFLKYASHPSMSCATPLPRLAGMIFERVSSSGAWSDTDKVNCKLRSASLSNFSVIPQVDSDMCLMPMFMPSAWLTSCRNLITLSKSIRISIMSTMCPIFRPDSFSENMTSSSISPASRLRTRPPMVDAQKAQPWRQPTWVEIQTLLP